MILKISLAWCQLKYKKRRLLVAIAGISFAVVLMFMQLGFQSALFDSAVRLHNSLRGDIFLLSTRSTALIGMKHFSERRLSQTLAFPEEVEFITPIYLSFAQWKNPTNPNYWRNIHVIGFDIRYSIFDLPGVAENITKLQMPDVVLFDRASRHEFGNIASLLKNQASITTEIDNIATETHQIKVVGLFTLGTSFGIDGNLITSHLNFLRIFSQRNKGFIEVGLIKLKPGVNSNLVTQKISNYLPPDVRVLSKQQWIDFEKKYWTSSTAIGFIFNLGVGMGLIVGTTIFYQILYTDITDNLSEYATLKAMGYQQKYLLSIIFQQSIIMAILGYIPGFLISSILYQIARNITLLPISMNPFRSLFVLFLTIFMCFISGTIAVQKLQDADPADIFN